MEARHTSGAVMLSILKTKMAKTPDAEHEDLEVGALFNLSTDGA